MMEKKTVTVIVPVYNVEDYLRKCVEARILQEGSAMRLLADMTS